MAIAASTRERLRIERLYGELSQYAVGACEQGKAMLVLKQEQLQALIDRVVEREKVRLQGFEAVVEARHPQNILRMGFALIRSAGKVVGSTDGLSAGAMVEIEMSDGKLSAEVKNVEKR